MIIKWILAENSELWLIFEKMILILLFKTTKTEPFQVCWYRFPLFRGYVIFIDQK